MDYVDEYWIKDRYVSLLGSQYNDFICGNIILKIDDEVVQPSEINLISQEGLSIIGPISLYHIDDKWLWFTKEDYVEYIEELCQSKS